MKDKMDKRENGKLLMVIILAIISSVFTALLFLVDRQPIGPNESVVGLATINDAVRNAIGVNVIWDKISDLTMIVAIMTAMSFAITGLVQLIKRKSLKKVDTIIWITAAVYVVIAICYVLFDKVLIINYRPVLEESGELESSFPSSHILVITTIMATAVSSWKKVFKDKTMLTNILRIVAILVIAVALASRVLSGVHWFTDIAGALLYSCLLVSVYDFVCEKIISEN